MNGEKKTSKTIGHSRTSSNGVLHSSHQHCLVFRNPRYFSPFPQAFSVLLFVFAQENKRETPECGAIECYGKKKELRKIIGQLDGILCIFCVFVFAFSFARENSINIARLIVQRKRKHNSNGFYCPGPPFHSFSASLKPFPF